MRVGAGAAPGRFRNNVAYDSTGNPTTLRGTSSIPYNRNNQRTGSETYAYDGNGNPTTYKSTTLIFDVENRLTQAGSAMTAGYNGDGVRAWKTAGSTTTYYLYDGTDLLCEMNANGTVTATNTWGANGLVSRRVGTTSTFYVYDPQGSVAQRLDGSGNVLSSDLYDAYGAKLTGNPNNDPYGYNGQWGYTTDSETGLALCTYRYYDPANGRWLNRDPIGYRGGVNVYGYVGGDPVNGSDPEGLKCPGELTISLCIDLCRSIAPKSLKKLADKTCVSICRAYSNKGCETLAEKCEFYAASGGLAYKRRAEICWILYNVICSGMSAPRGYR